MNVKKYRVICWQPSTSSINDEIFVDIAPESGVVHDMIFYSRLKLYRGNDSNKKIVSRAGSVYLCIIDDGREIDVVFEQHTDIQRERLVPLILNTYKAMRKNGKETTLPVLLSAWEAEKMADEFRSPSAKRDADIFEKRERERRNMFARKHFASTPQEERILHDQKETSDAISRKQISLAEQAKRDALKDPVSRMKEKMQQYSGD